MTETTTRVATVDPSGHAGPTEHGPATSQARRLIKSAVWGDTMVTVTSENGADVTPWNPDCSWYQYGIDYGLNGCQHPGMDIGLEYGTSLYAAEGGEIVFAGPDQYYQPQHVNILTASGEVHIYGHMSSVDGGLEVGGQVAAGQYLGESGEQNGPHLHFERRVPSGNCSSGYCIGDPEPVLTGAPNGHSIVSPDNLRPVDPGFADGDRIEVFDGPLNLRQKGNLQADILASLAEGAVMTVTGGPVTHDGYVWYRVAVEGGPDRGWLAGRFCRKVS